VPRGAALIHGHILHKGGNDATTEFSDDRFCPHVVAVRRLLRWLDVARVRFRYKAEK
jgi:hypothetical protein